ncbi:MAG: class I SAM-dependent methyltransferase [Dehalococcoidia bacterium]
MPLLGEYARRKRIEFFTPYIPKEAKVLEVGCRDGWFGDYLKNRGWNYVGLDIMPPADIVGDIRNWEQLGIEKESFDVVVAFELVEHVHCFHEFREIMKPGGLLMLTSPVPHMDWLFRVLEFIGLNQKRTSPHNNLIYFRDIPFFQPLKIKIVGLAGQWGMFRKPLATSRNGD